MQSARQIDNRQSNVSVSLAALQLECLSRPILHCCDSLANRLSSQQTTQLLTKTVVLNQLRELMSFPCDYACDRSRGVRGPSRT
eukprot:195851-Rhodomonas_salina.1